MSIMKIPDARPDMRIVSGILRTHEEPSKENTLEITFPLPQIEAA